MIAPLAPCALRGAIWYQGESNAGRYNASLYGTQLAMMIRNWRQLWGQGDFPFPREKRNASHLPEVKAYGVVQPPDGRLRPFFPTGSTAFLPFFRILVRFFHGDLGPIYDLYIHFIEHHHNIVYLVAEYDVFRKCFVKLFVSNMPLLLTLFDKAFHSFQGLFFMLQFAGFNGHKPP